ncbi:MAG: hypothetical protein K6F94_03405 [Bacteroidaceae bacterium]|nr:hypothetical protein [Bacteroidaceae bacterium]
MFFANDEDTQRLKNLLRQGGEYWQLQRRMLSLQSASTLAKLLATIALWLIVFLVGSLVLLFASFALAFWLGDISGSNLLGFGVIALVLLLVVLLVYSCRQQWIYLPVARYMIDLLVSPTPEGFHITDMTQATEEMTRVSEQLNANREQLKESAQDVFIQNNPPSNKWELAGELLKNGRSIYRAMQLGVNLWAAIRLLLGSKKRRR